MQIFPPSWKLYSPHYGGVRHARRPFCTRMVHALRDRARTRPGGGAGAFRTAEETGGVLDCGGGVPDWIGGVPGTTGNAKNGRISLIGDSLLSMRHDNPDQEPMQQGESGPPRTRPTKRAGKEREDAGKTRGRHTGRLQIDDDTERSARQLPSARHTRPNSRNVTTRTPRDNKPNQGSTRRRGSEVGKVHATDETTPRGEGFEHDASASLRLRPGAPWRNNAERPRDGERRGRTTPNRTPPTDGRKRSTPAPPADIGRSVRTAAKDTLDATTETVDEARRTLTRSGARTPPGTPREYASSATGTVGQPRCRTVRRKGPALRIGTTGRSGRGARPRQASPDTQTHRTTDEQDRTGRHYARQGYGQLIRRQRTAAAGADAERSPTRANRVRTTLTTTR